MRVWLNIFLVIGFIFSVMGCAERAMVKEGGAQVTEAQGVQNLSFAGERVILNWTERGVQTLNHDGEIVRIMERGGLYYIESPGRFFNVTKFRPTRSETLSGNYAATYWRSFQC